MEGTHNAGTVLAGLGIVILLGLVALTRQGDSYMLWADIVFGFIAAGLFLLGLFQTKK